MDDLTRRVEAAKRRRDRIKQLIEEETKLKQAMADEAVSLGEELTALQNDLEQLHGEEG